MSRPGRPARLFALVAVAVIVAGLAAALWAYGALNRPYRGWEGERVDVILPDGVSATAMLERLAQAGVLRDPRLLRRWLVLSKQAGDLRAGEYRFERAASPLDIVDRLRAGDVVLHATTIPEGLHLDEIALRFAESGLFEPSALLAAFRDPSPIADLDPQADDLEGYLFPETYHSTRGELPSRLAATMVENFRRAVGEDYAARAAAIGLDLRQAVTLASMIERETSVAGERRRISRVFHNRLRLGMPMQCDPTVLYALHRAGHDVQILTGRHLAFDSPWNTYVVRELPPGPIANPGLASLLAAVDPDDGDELYFVAAPGGGHVFSRTLAAHNRAATEWRRYSRSSR